MSGNPKLLHLPGHDANRGTPRRVLDWLEDNARQYGLKSAIEAIDRPALNHAGLYHQVRQASDLLLDNNIGRGDVVLIMLPNGPEALTALLSATSVAVALPLGTNEPMQAIADAVSQTTARAIIYDHAHPALAPQLIEQFNLTPLPVAVDRSLPAGTLAFLQQRPGGQRAIATQIDDAATLGRTAGTSSKPRVVAWSQASLYRSADVVAQWMGLTQQDRSLCVMPFITLHTMVRSCMPGLMRGGAVICTPGFDKVRVLDWIRDYQPTYMTAVPGIYKEILLRAGAQPLQTSLRFLASGSDRIDSETVVQLARTFNVSVREFYGMNEVSPMLAASPEGVLAQTDGITGKPMSDWQLEVRDESGTSLPCGAQGEIVVNGGYLNPTLDGSARVEEGWYLTGDAGFIDQEGRLHVTGRMDDRITRGGKKIAPNMVEQALQAHPQIVRAVAFPIPDEILGQRLGALVITDPGPAPSELELRSYVADSLLDYMVPERIVFGDSVPLTEIGKVSRKRLAQQLDLTSICSQSTGPTTRKTQLTQTEESLLEIVRELLQQPNIDAADDFMQCGGDSFAATVLLVEIEEKFGALLTPGQFLGNSSVEQLAVLIDANATGQTPLELETIQAGRNGEPPLFFAHGPDGYALYSHFVARHLNTDQGVYAFRYSEQYETTSMEAYAAHYASAMQSIQPEGPFFLAGHSFGAQLAFETARQLVAAGREIAFLALLDDEADLFKRKFNVVNLPSPAPFTFNLFRRMLDCYTASLYPGDIELFVAESPPLERLADPYMGWADIAVGDISSFEVTGDHTSMMAESNINHWGALFAQRFENARISWPARQRDWPLRLATLRERLSRPDVVATITARSASRTGELDTEISAYLCAIQEQPNQPYWVYRNLGEALDQSGDVVKARTYYEQAILLEKNPIPGTIQLASFLKKSGQADEASALLRRQEKTIQSLPINESMRALIALAYSWCSLGDAVEAERLALRALGLKPMDTNAMLALSQALTDQRRLDEALRALEDTIAISPNLHQAFFRTGVVQKLRGNLEASEQALVRASELVPRLPHPYRQLSTIYDMQQRKEEAIEAARKATELDPCDPMLLVYCGQLALRNNHLELAESSLRSAVEQKPELASVHRMLSRIYKEQQQKKLALQALLKASILDSKSNFRNSLSRGLYRSAANSYQILKMLIS